MWRIPLVCALLMTPVDAVVAQEDRALSVEVFPFELEDRSAGAGIIPPDAYDLKYLEESQQVARDMLVGSGRFNLVESPASIDYAAVAPHGLRNCNGCEGEIARHHGASLALLGVVTRVNRTEHTMFIRILDAKTGATVSKGFTDLRMGANYAWPRSVKWLMKNRILEASE